MADTIVAASLTLDGTQANQSVKSFKQELREANAEVLGLSEKFGATSKEAVGAAKRVAELKDRLGDAKTLSDAFNPDAKFKGFANVVQAVAGGFSALTGTMALFGTESKDVEKALLKVQSAMAISQGINSILEGKDAFIAFGAQIKNASIVQKMLATSTALSTTVMKVLGITTNTTSTGFKLLRGAIIATGIGALVVAAGYLITNFKEVKQVVYNLIPGLETMGKYIGYIVQKAGDLIGITSKSERSLDRMADVTKKLNERYEEQIKILSAQGGKEKEIAELRQNIATNDLRVLDQKKKAGKELTEEEIKQSRELATEKQVIAIQEQERLKQVAEEAKKEAAKNSEEAKHKREEAKKKREERLKELNQELEDAKKFRAEMQTDAEDALVKINALDAEEVQGKKDLFNQRIANTRQAIQEEANVMSELKYLQMDQISQQESEELYRLGSWYSERYEIIKGNAVAEAELVKQYEGIKAKIEHETFNQRLQIVSGFLGNAADLIGKHTIAGKVLAVGEATISTYLSAQKAYNSMIGIPIVGPVLAPVAAGVAIAAGLKNIREITKVKLPGASGGAPSMPSISAPAPLSPQMFSPQVVSTKLPQDQINQMGNFASRAYVLESDVSNSQERNKMLNRQARLGG